MTQRSTGGERERLLAETLANFEGLVWTTAHMFASQLRKEEEDLAQELRVRAWYAIERYDPTRSRLPLERFVYGALANKVKDFKRDAAREMRRREKYNVAFLHIEDTLTFDGEDSSERFAGLHHHVTHDEVYGEIERKPFELPAGVSGAEARVLVLLIFDHDRSEIALLLGMSKPQVDQAVRSLRLKFADWRPNSAVVRELPVRRALAAAA